MYPECDRQPAADKDIHRLLKADAEFALRTHFRGQQVYVSSNLFLYHTEGDPQARVSPDLFVVKGVHPGMRKQYLLWEERQVPCVVFEFESRARWFANEQLYAKLGVQEYYIFDPSGEYKMPPFQAYRLDGGRFQQMAPAPGAHSPALNLDILADRATLYFVDPVTRKRLPTPQESWERADRLEAEVTELRRRLGELPS